VIGFGDQLETLFVGTEQSRDHGWQRGRRWYRLGEGYWGRGAFVFEAARVRVVGE